jgi:TonB family protein
MRQKRPLLVVVSLGVHLAIVLALFVAGFWKLDRLDAPRRTIDLAVAPPPPPAPSGSPAAGEPEPFTRKRPKVKPPVITQPEIVKSDEVVATASTASTAIGTGGAGTGDGSGSGTDPEGTGDCVGDHCGPAEEPKPVIEKKQEIDEGPEIVIPAVIKGMRKRGNTQIQMSEVDKTQLLRAGKHRANATVKVCVSANGSVMSLAIVRGSGISGWDAAILAAVRAWEYEPHRIGKRAVPVCGMVTFLYEIR